MAIKVGQAFERTSAQPIDTSLTLTKAQMVTVNDNLMPPYYFTICQDDGKIYLYDKSATASASTGKFTEFSGGSGSGSPVYLSATLLDKDVNDPTIVALSNLTKSDDSTVHPILSEIVLGTTVIYDADGTMGVATAKSGTNVTVTTATTSTPTKELTQAEYDALTEAEKKNGTIYFITDNYVGSTYVGAYDTIYSTTERVIGSYMGKPLYQRTWTSSTRESISNTSWGQQFSIPKAGMEQLVQCICSDNQYGQAWKVLANLDSSATYVSFMACRDNSDFFATDVTLQYTKTTDTTSPVEYAFPNDYSTSEKIVGTWVDGKPIYQKSITWTSQVPYDTWTGTGVSISEIDELIDVSNLQWNYDTSSKQIIPVLGLANSNGIEFLSIRNNNYPSANNLMTIKYTKVSS